MGDIQLSREEDHPGVPPRRVLGEQPRRLLVATEVEVHEDVATSQRARLRSGAPQLSADDRVAGVRGVTV